MNEQAQLQQVCSECGDVYARDETLTGAYCPACRPTPEAQPHRARRGSTKQRGYDSRWRRLSERARRLSPVCEDCGAVDDLTTDHSERAWQRKESGLPIRLEDVAVVCRRCNTDRGAARGKRAAHRQWERDLSQLAADLIAEGGE